MLPSTEEIADITESVPQTTSHVTNTASKSMSLVMLVHVLVTDQMFLLYHPDAVAAHVTYIVTMCAL